METTNPTVFIAGGTSVITDNSHRTEGTVMSLATGTCSSGFAVITAASFSAR